MPSLLSAYNYILSVCNDDSNRYSQDHRNKQTIDGYTYYDCSSLINYALLEGGWETPDYAPDHNAFTTPEMPDVLKSLGFDEYTVDSSFEWKKGDISWYRDSDYGHTEMCYQAGVDGSAIFMGARTDENVSIEDEVTIDPAPSTLYTYCYRYPQSDIPDNDTDIPDNGTNLYVIAAMCGNFWWESGGINAGIWEHEEEQDSYEVLGHGYGIGQWTNAGPQGRLFQLWQWMTLNQYEMTSLEGQIKYISVEGTWYTTHGYFNSLNDFLSSDSTDLDMLTEAWYYEWESPPSSDTSLPTRKEYAQKCYDYILAHADDTSITEPIYGNRILSESEALNNAVMFYRYWGGGSTPVPIPKPSRRRRMPVWMMLRRR